MLSQVTACTTLHISSAIKPRDYSWWLCYSIYICLFQEKDMEGITKVDDDLMPLLAYPPIAKLALDVFYEQNI
jgi:hypothetical protein